MFRFSFFYSFFFSVAVRFLSAWLVVFGFSEPTSSSKSLSSYPNQLKFYLPFYINCFYRFLGARYTYYVDKDYGKGGGHCVPTENSLTLKSVEYDFGKVRVSKQDIHYFK